MQDLNFIKVIGVVSAKLTCSFRKKYRHDYDAKELARGVFFACESSDCYKVLFKKFYLSYSII